MRRAFAVGFVVLALLAVGVVVVGNLRFEAARAPEPARRIPGDDGARVRVEVLNGAGLPGAARSVTSRLRDIGYDVVDYGNYGNARPFDQDSSQVVDRVGRIESARAVAEGLGIRNVRSEPDSNLFVDVSVVLGADWDPEHLSRLVGDTVLERSWWDPRGWLGR